MSGCGPLGPWNKPNFNKFEWSSLEVNYWIVISDNNLLQRNFLLCDTGLIREGVSKILIKEIHSSTVPTSPQMHWNVANGDKWHASIIFENTLSFTKKGHKLFYAYYVDLENSDFYEWLRQQCLKDAQKDFPGITLESVKLRANLSLNSSKYKSFELPQPISEATQNQIVKSDMWKALGFKVERYDAEGCLRSEEIINKELTEALKDSWESFRRYQEQRKRMKKETAWPEPPGWPGGQMSNPRANP
jgi:hypothetical protein